MIVKYIKDVEKINIEADNVKYVEKQILIGPNDGSTNIRMRLFTVKPGGYTFYHTHDYEHLIKIEKGKGIAIDKDGEHIIEEGMVLFVKPNEIHQFKNNSDSELQFICVIPNV